MKEKVMVVAKTYPNLSSKYDETVCVAGIKSDNNWIRIFPVRYRKLPYSQRFKKFDIIECDVEKTNDKFMRKESHKVDDSTIKIVGGFPVSSVSKKQADTNWLERKKIMLCNLNKSIEQLEEEKEKNHVTIGIIKPVKIVDFYKKKVDDCRDWERDLINGTQKTLLQGYKTPLDKVSYWLGYHFFCEDKRCKGHNMMSEDWETIELFRQMKEKYKDNELAFQRVREKYFNWMQGRDLYFVVGTESRWNKFLIISVFYPPK